MDGVGLGRTALGVGVYLIVWSIRTRLSSGTYGSVIELEVVRDNLRFKVAVGTLLVPKIDCFFSAPPKSRQLPVMLLPEEEELEELELEEEEVEEEEDLAELGREDRLVVVVEVCT